MFILAGWLSLSAATTLAQVPAPDAGLPPEPEPPTPAPGSPAAPEPRSVLQSIDDYAVPPPASVERVQPTTPSSWTPSAAVAPSRPRARADAVPPQPKAAAEPESSGRMLGGHAFPLAVFLPTALSFSYFGIRAGIEYHSQPGITRDLSFFGTGAARTTDLQTVNAAETVDAAVRVHDYVVLLGTGYGLARVGANVETLLGTGADYTYGGDLGALIKILRYGGFQLAARAEFGYYAGQQAGIIELFQDIGEIVQFTIGDLAQVRDVSEIDVPGRLEQIQDGIYAATAAMLTPFRGVEYGASLNMAQAFGQPLGLQLSLGLFRKQASYDLPMFDAETASLARSRREVNRSYPRLSAALDVDFGSLGVGLDVMVEYQLTRVHIESELTDQDYTRDWTEHLVAFGAYYAGDPRLQLGVTVYFLFGQSPVTGANTQSTGRPLDIGTQFVFRYSR